MSYGIFNKKKKKELWRSNQVNPIHPICKMDYCRVLKNLNDLTRLIK
jgi:hypothetical protein